ncbi:MAG: glutamine cyclotransferase [Verrucomicrobiales bacterium]|nr:glutamine cyclotransferase [Verrucomicrobiales bacterium]
MKSGPSTPSFSTIPALAALVLGCVTLIACDGHETKSAPPAAATAAILATAAAPKRFTFYTAEIVDRFPHDSRAFTQGLLFENATTLLESTGLNGQSSLRRVELATGKVLQKTGLPDHFFGEGLTQLGGRLYQLTWKDHKGFIYDPETFREIGTFPYAGEGWGLATDGTSLILSDGTQQLRFLDPKTFAVTRTLNATHQGKPVDRLNELEYVDGEIFANIWGADQIARIDPATGEATGVIDCSGLFPLARRSTPEQVLNGIAWHPETKRLLITGKWWPEIFEVKLVPRP